MACTHPCNKGGPGEMQKSCKRGDPEQFGLIRGELRGFMFSWGGQGVLGPFFLGGGTVPPLPAMNFGSSNLEVSPSEGKNNTGVVLVSNHAWKCAHTAISGGVDISEVPGCHLL